MNNEFIVKVIDVVHVYQNVNCVLTPCGHQPFCNVQIDQDSMIIDVQFVEHEYHK